jgi:sugar phosphate isomerase/epimerase
MSSSGIVFSVFTKPWKIQASELGALVSSLGFDGIELPVRPGYEVEPANVGRDLLPVSRKLREFGVRIFSVAGPADEPTIAACAEAGIPVIRIMAPIGSGGYLATEVELQRQFDAFVPLLDKYGVTLGVQNHNGNFVCNASGLRRLIEKYDPRHVCAVWDAAHTALNGEAPELAIDLVWSHLGMVNLKNAFWQRTNGPEAKVAQWKPYWTTGRHGLASWPRVVAELKRRGYQGVVCLTAEYTDEAEVKRLVAEDLAFARLLFSETGGF